MALPVEIWHQICDELSDVGVITRKNVPDLGNIQLVCKDLANIGAEYLFRKVGLWLDDGSIDRFKHVADHPQLAACVQELSLWIGIVDCPQEDEEDIFDFISDTDRRDEDVELDAYMPEIRKVHRKWLSIRQRQLEQALRIQKVLGGALQNFSKLRLVRTRSFESYPINGRKGKTYRLYSSMTISKESLITFIFQNIHKDAKLKVFEWDSFSWDFFDARDEDEKFPSFEYMSKHLAKIELVVSPPGSRDTMESTPLMQQRLTKFLSCAPNLTHLSLDLQSECDRGCVSFQSIFGDCVWPCINTLELFQTELDPEHTLAFFERHKNIIKEVLFSSILHVTYDFMHFLRRLKSIVVLSKRLRLGGYFSNNAIPTLHPNAVVFQELCCHYYCGGHLKHGEITLGSALDYLLRGVKIDDPQELGSHQRQPALNEFQSAKFWEAVTWELVSESNLGQLHKASHTEM